MTGLKTVFETTKSLNEARTAYMKFHKGNSVDGMIEATKLFDTYLTQYSTYVAKGSDEYVAKLRKLGAGPKAIEALTKSKQTTARRISEMSSGVKKSLAIVDKAK
ncbi:MAG: hypothetical protein GY706_02255 [Bacteroides sp.]|nr:hypothetical protein [Bacteroides sp.]